MSFKYYIQKLFGLWLDSPTFKEGKTVGYSLVRSDKNNFTAGIHSKVYPPFYLSDTSLGAYSYVAKNANISHCRIGKFCSIGPNFCCGLGIHPIDGLSTSPMFYSKERQNGVSLCKENKVEEYNYTVIGNDVFIGANVTVLDGVTIGDGAVIGAGAVVVNDIPPYAVAVGVPAIVKKFRFDEHTISKLLEKQWWNGTQEDFKKVEEHFRDISAFLQD